ncbi:hypothetical protein F-liban_364 [Faustovirus]|nr:hypothetical protein PRJ_Fausto_00368 [Faustovirus]QBR99275.1 hypothetical protein [Faustovirus mariensis]AMN83307.1 hypothetical protein E24_00391 [Faustovirus]AMN84290.1 hypothetical protein D5a_00390 [Faustovirus]AMN85278.1 hypothetical protein E23_00391 [Faustovirus]
MEHTDTPVDNNEYLLRFEQMEKRLEAIVGGFAEVKAVSKQGIAGRVVALEHTLENIIIQLKDIHETLIDLNNNFVENSDQSNE